jgi:hypothetical protein
VQKKYLRTDKGFRFIEMRIRVNVQPVDQQKMKSGEKEFFQTSRTFRARGSLSSRIRRPREGRWVESEAATLAKKVASQGALIQNANGPTPENAGQSMISASGTRLALARTVVSLSHEEN